MNQDDDFNIHKDIFVLSALAEEDRLAELEEENDEMRKKLGLPPKDRPKRKNHFDVILNVMLICSIIGIIAFVVFALTILK